MNCKTHDVLSRLSLTLKERIEAESCSESQMARAVGVTHPTLSRMLHPDRPGSDGVAIRHWLRALQITGHLQPLVKRMERQARRLLLNKGKSFLPLDDRPVKMTDSHVEPPNPDDEIRVDLSLLRVGHAMQSVIPISRVRSARQLAMAIGVTQPTLSNLLSPSGDHAGGTAIQHFIQAASVLDMGRVFDQVLPEHRRASPEERIGIPEPVAGQRINLTA